MNKNYVLFQAYGNEQVLAECRFALMQLLNHNNPDEFTIVVYTDNESYLKHELGLFKHKTIRKILPGEINDWKGGINFVHRVKIKILQDFFTNNSGNVIYCDTDTCCTQSLRHIFEGISKGDFYMHLNEGQISRRGSIDARKWDNFFKKNAELLRENLLLHPEKTCMVNAGVIGMNSTKAYLLEQVVSITDIIFPKFPRHNAEQFAFSYVLQQNGKVLCADKEIFHYWDLKEYRILLQTFFAAAEKTPALQQQKILQHFLPQLLLREKLNYKKFFFLFKLFKKKWSIEMYLPTVLESIEKEKMH
jgi:hypothetical protein